VTLSLTFALKTQMDLIIWDFVDRADPENIALQFTAKLTRKVRWPSW